MTFRLPHLFAALLLHVVLFSLLLGGLQCSLKPTRPPVISAVLLDPSRQDLAEQKRRAEERRRAETEKQRKLEQDQQKKAAAEQKQKELEQQRKAAADAAKQKKADELKRKQEAAAEKKKAAEQKKAEEAAKRKQEQDEKREQVAAAKREQEEKQRMDRAMEEEARVRDLQREQQAREASEREKQLAQWADVLSRHVARNWVRPPGTAEDFSCTVRVQLLPDGSVTSAKIVKSCGNGLLDKSVEDAVFRSSPVPKPADPSVFDRDLTINFVPQSQGP